MGRYASFFLPISRQAVLKKIDQNAAALATFPKSKTVSPLLAASSIYIIAIESPAETELSASAFRMSFLSRVLSNARLIAKTAMHAVIPVFASVKLVSAAAVVASKATAEPCIQGFH